MTPTKDVASVKTCSCCNALKLRIKLTRSGIYYVYCQRCDR